MVKKIGKLLTQIEKFEKHILMEAVFAVFFECINPFIPLIGIAYVIEYVLNTEYNRACCVFIGMLVLKNSCAYCSSCLSFNILRKKQLLFTDFRIHVKDVYLSFSYEEAQRSKIKDTLNSIDYNCFMYGGLEEIVSIVQSMCKNGLTIFLSSIVVYILLLKKDVDEKYASNYSMMIFGASLVLLVIFLIKIIKNAKKYVDKEEKLYDEHCSTEKSLNYYMNNFYGNPETIQTIQQYEMYELIYRKVRLGVEESIALFSKIRDYRLYEKMTYFFVNCLSCIFIYGILVYKICLGAISIGDFALCYGVIIGVSSAIAGIIEDYAKIKIAVTRLDDYIFLFDSMNKCENEIGNTDFEFTDSDVIRLKDVSYKYPESDKNVLNKINLELYNNEKVAIVGPNGAGKSTLVKCICGLLPVTEGDIFIGTKNIKNMNQVQKKEFFGTVFQEYAYLPFSLGENISLKENYNRDRAINLLNGFNCDGKLIADKNNIDKIVALSEGQKQKVAVSRARYEKHKCYILDEPSASMDILSEQKLYEEYGKITNEKLCILISHRMTSCIHSDRIIVMDQGSIIDIGSHIELLKRCKLYRTMWEKQTEHYIE